MRAQLCFALMLASLFIAGCVTKPQGPACITPAPMLEYCLLGHQALQPLVGEARMVTITGMDESRRDMYFSIGGTSDRVVMDASSLFGQHVFTVIQQGSKISVSPPGRFAHPEWLVGLLQLAYLPINTLQPRIRGVELDQVEVDGAIERRTFRHGESEILVIEYAPKEDVIRIVAKEIEIRIRNPAAYSGRSSGTDQEGNSR